MSNASGGQVDAAQPQGEVSIPRDETLINEIAELKKHAQKLMGRIQEQTDRYRSLDTKFSGELADTTDKFTGMIILFTFYKKYLPGVIIRIELTFLNKYACSILSE